MKVKIDLDLPTVPDEAMLYVLAGIELVAYKTVEGTWYKKVGKCRMCGKCCRLPYKNPVFPLKDDHCAYLLPVKDQPGKFACSLGIHRPIACSVGHHDPGEKLKDPRPLVKECTEGFEEVASNM